MKRFSEKLMGMNDSTWERHSNPVSVYSRIFSYPLIILALWSYHFWDLLYALGLGISVVLWLYVNPRLFKVPRSTNNWASKVTFGERIWLHHENRTEIPCHHSKIFISTLLIVSGIGFIGTIYFSMIADFKLTLLASLMCWGAKVWYCDRMVWLFEDMKNFEKYSAWVYE